MSTELDDRIRATVHTIAHTAADPIPWSDLSVPRNAPEPVHPRYTIWSPRLWPWRSSSEEPPLRSQFGTGRGRSRRRATHRSSIPSSSSRSHHVGVPRAVIADRWMLIARTSIPGTTQQASGTEAA